MIVGWIENLLPRAIGAVFLYAGAHKAWDLTRTMRVLEFDGLPAPLVAPLANALWAIEVAVGLALLLGFARRRVIGAAVLLLLIFSVQLAYLIAAQNPPDCACPGLAMNFRSAKNTMVFGLVRNAVMAACLEWCRLRQIMTACDAAESGAPPHGTSAQ